MSATPPSARAARRAEALPRPLLRAVLRWLPLLRMLASGEAPAGAQLDVRSLGGRLARSLGSAAAGDENEAAGVENDGDLSGGGTGGDQKAWASASHRSTSAIF